jgi:hypothetical protein
VEESDADVLILTQYFFVYAVEKLSAKKYWLLQHDDGLLLDFAGLHWLRKEGFQEALKKIPVLAVSKWIQAQLKQKYNKHSFYVPLGVDTDFFCSDQQNTVSSLTISAMYDDIRMERYG